MIINVQLFKYINIKLLQQNYQARDHRQDEMREKLVLEP